MAKDKVGGSTQKTTFGKRKGGKAAKTHNKYDRKERNFRGQGR